MYIYIHMHMHLHPPPLPPRSWAAGRQGGVVGTSTALQAGGARGDLVQLQGMVVGHFPSCQVEARGAYSEGCPIDAFPHPLRHLLVFRERAPIFEWCPLQGEGRRLIISLSSPEQGKERPRRGGDSHIHLPKDHIDPLAPSLK